MCKMGTANLPPMYYKFLLLQLISDRELSNTVTQIYDTVLEVLCADHFDYALDIVFTSVYHLVVCIYIYMVLLYCVCVLWYVKFCNACIYVTKYYCGLLV